MFQEDDYVTFVSDNTEEFSKTLQENIPAVSIMEKKIYLHV